MDTGLFDYELPPALIAQEPAEPRDSSRLLVLHRREMRIEHRRFRDIGEYLETGDLLVANDSRVIRARLHGRKPTGGRVEVFLLHPEDDTGCQWQCLVRGRGMGAGAVVTLEPAPERAPGPDDPGERSGGAQIGSGLTGTVTAVHDSGSRSVLFSEPIPPLLEGLGEIPLPPYITAYTGDPERYQTVYGRPEGSVAAPTAGLHFTADLLLALHRRGIALETVTLHVGLDTFKPVEAERIEDHRIHSEWAELGAAAARRINDTSLQGKRIVAVGTTTVRTLEYAATGAQGLDPYAGDACPWQRTVAFQGAVDLYIRPGYRFRAVDALITNFHLPRSSLLMLVSAFVGQGHEDPDEGRRRLLSVYEEAKAMGYRFYSFGDAMLIL